MSKVTVLRKHSFLGHRDAIYALEPSLQDHIFFTGSGDGMVVKWDLTNPDKGELVAKLPNSVYAIHHIPNTNILAIGHNYEGLHFVDHELKKEVGSLKFTEASIFDIKSYKNLLIVAQGAGQISYLTSDDLKVVKTEKIASQNIRCIAINHISHEYAIGTSDNEIRIHDLHSLMLKRVIKNHTNSVFALRYTPAGDALISAGRDAHLKIWDVKANYLQIDDITAHMYAINHIAFSPDAKHFVTCSMDKTIKIWDISALKLLKVIDKARHQGHASSVNKVLWSPYDNTLISVSDDKAISLWDLEFNI